MGVAKKQFAGPNLRRPLRGRRAVPTEYAGARICFTPTSILPHQRGRRPSSSIFAGNPLRLCSGQVSPSKGKPMLFHPHLAPPPSKGEDVNYLHWWWQSPSPLRGEGRDGGGKETVRWAKSPTPSTRWAGSTDGICKGGDIVSPPPQSPSTVLRASSPIEGEADIVSPPPQSSPIEGGGR